jgi:hypothetical protein
MTKFIILYSGPATPPSEMSEKQSHAIMQKWSEWMEKTGNSLVDIGAPMTNGTSVVDDGSDGPASELSGYSIVQADSIHEAKDIVADHPFLSDGEGKFKIEIHELAPVPAM